METHSNLKFNAQRRQAGNNACSHKDLRQNVGTELKDRQYLHSPNLCKGARTHRILRCWYRRKMAAFLHFLSWLLGQREAREGPGAW